jgi:hypothetical protein
MTHPRLKSIAAHSPSRLSVKKPTTCSIGWLTPRKNACSTSSACAESTMAIEFPDDFKEFLKLLNSHQVEYLLIGGYAVGYYGYPRATGDMDIWIALGPQNAQRLLQVLNDFGFGASVVTEETFLAENKIIRMGNPPFRIEILTGISGVDFAACYSQRMADVIDGIPVNLINLEHLKQNKRASGRYKDLDDLDNLP